MGDITVVVRADLLLYSFIIDIILIIYLYKHSYRKNYSASLYGRIIIGIAVVTAFEAVSWLTGEVGNEALIPVHYWSNVLFLAFLGLPAALGFCYLDYRILGNKDKCKKRLLLYLIPTYINIGFAIYNLFNDGFLFSINGMNQYSRGIAVTISSVILYIVLIIVVISFYRYKKMITGRIIQSIIIFFFFPIIGSLIQILAYGTTFGMPSYTLAIFVIFLILEKDEMGKDELTGLYTRVKLIARLKFKLKARESFSLIMTDINDFKYINDTYGHSEGDRALKKVADILVNSINVEDMVCRYGGDEFLMLIECGEDIGEKIISRIESKLAKHDKSFDYNINISYGCEFVAETSDVVIEDLLHRVDRKMYKNKQCTKKDLL